MYTDCIPCYIGLALQFLTKVFQSWVKEKDFANLSSSLRKAELENKLLVSLCFSNNKGSDQHFSNKRVGTILEEWNIICSKTH